MLKPRDIQGSFYDPEYVMLHVGMVDIEELNKGADRTKC